MSCCGRNRTTTRETNTAAGGVGLSTENPAPPPSAAAAGAVWLRYVGSSSVAVRGPATRRTYSFSGTHLIQRVDARDAASLVRTGMFRQTW